ncbi:hypothetical protein BDV95DRAFT_663608 [Massariosphaeria phaeospora]|uniref:Jacalin-type lectin domain-containing protein n=1 Tax=Massariosphaeria phaeospora TaxID=100035 RepID=A0A7C8MJQ0_9PLEO|nr:hypothetical protein BDV95DRAFT_663608 [Massariosphaeria phaeospora]
MRITPLALGLVARFFTTVTAIGDCDDAPTALSVTMGVMDDSTGALPICETHWKQGHSVKKIETWTNENTFLGYMLTYTSLETSYLVGSGPADAKYSSFEWDPLSETVERIEMWNDNNKDGNRLGKIKIILTNGRTFEAGEDHPGHNMVTQRGFGGVIFGTYGWATWNVHSLGFIMMKSKVKKIEVGDVQFGDLQKGSTIKHRRYDTDRHYNNLTEPQEHSWAREYMEKASSSTSQVARWSFGGGYSLGFSAAPMGMGVSSTWSINFEVGEEKTKEWAEEHEQKVKWEDKVMVKPKHTLICTGYAEAGELDLEYMSKVKVTLQDNSQFEFMQPGTKQATAFTDAYSKCTEVEGDQAQSSLFVPWSEKKRSIATPFTA